MAGHCDAVRVGLGFQFQTVGSVSNDLVVAFGLDYADIGMLAGVIMALTGEAMSPERRAFGMGVFLSVYFLINAAAPPIAGWIYDATNDPFSPVIFGIVLFGLVIVTNAWFRMAQRKDAPSVL